MSDANNGSAAPKKDLKKIFSLLFAVVDLVVVGGGAYLVYSSTLGFKTKAAFDRELQSEWQEHRKMLEEEPIYYTMDAFNTNLEGLPRRFIRAELSVEMYNKEGFEELVSLGGESRDAILNILNAKKLEELDSVQGKLHLKNEIIAHLNQALERGVVKNIYFTKFQVQ